MAIPFCRLSRFSMLEMPDDILKASYAPRRQSQHECHDRHYNACDAYYMIMIPLMHYRCRARRCGSIGQMSASFWQARCSPHTKGRIAMYTARLMTSRSADYFFFRCRRARYSARMITTASISGAPRDVAAICRADYLLTPAARVYARSHRPPEAMSLRRVNAMLLMMPSAC